MIVRLEGKPLGLGLLPPKQATNALIRFSTVTQEFVVEWLAQHGIVPLHRLWLINGIVVEAPRSILRLLAQFQVVTGISLDTKLKFDTSAPTDRGRCSADAEWHLKAIRAPDVWKNEDWKPGGITGGGTIVGVVDCGMDPHPALAGRLKHWKDFETGSTEPIDTHDKSHGTAMASVIAGARIDGKSVGVAPGASLAVALVSYSGSSINGMQWMTNPDGDEATDDSVRVINCSFTVGKSTADVVNATTIAEAISNLRELGIVVCCTAGNLGGTPGSVTAPGSSRAAFTIAGMQNTFGAVPDIGTQVIAESGQGPSSDSLGGYQKPNVAAPGEGVLCAIRDGGSERKTGTSPACAVVAGTIALMLERQPDMTVDQICEILQSTARDIHGSGIDSFSGHGCIDAYAAVEKCDGKETVASLPTGLGRGERTRRILEIIEHLKRYRKYVPDVHPPLPPPRF